MEETTCKDRIGGRIILKWVLKMRRQVKGGTSDLAVVNTAMNF
jgi:hypothetical protein